MRRALNLSTKLASALLAIKDSYDGQPLIPWEHAKQMSAQQIISLFQFDHYPIRHEAGGPDEPWNIVPRFIPEHRRKTAKIDVPEIAKIKRISKSEREFRERLLIPRADRPMMKSKWPKRPMGKKR